jgi:hypothetical protein
VRQRAQGQALLRNRARSFRGEPRARLSPPGPARAAALDLGPISDGDFARLLDELVELRAHELSLQLELPKLFSPALDRLLDAMEHDEVDVGEAPFWELLDRLDTPPERGRLAREVIALCAAGGLDRELAAAALIDLASGSRRLLSASLLDAATASAIASAIAIVCGGCGDREA